MENAENPWYYKDFEGTKGTVTRGFSRPPRYDRFDNPPYMNCRQADFIGYSIFLEIFLEMLFSVAFGVPEKSVFTRLFCVFATAMLANFQDRLVMTASITLRVCYLIVFFLAFRILDRDHFGQVFYRLKNGVFWTSFGVLHLASSRGCQTFQGTITHRKLKDFARW